MPFKVWVIGEEVLSADFNPYVQEQVVATFATAAARAAAVLAPKNGQVSWLDDVKRLEVYNGTAWVAVPTDAAPRGVVARAVLAADSAAVAGGPTTIAGFTATWTAVAGRRYKTTLIARVVGTVSGTPGTNYGDECHVRLSVDGSVAHPLAVTCARSGRPYGGTLTAEGTYAAGARSAVTTLQLNNGTSVLLQAGSEMLVEDIGT